MTPRNIDLSNHDNLSHICSRAYEDHLDWLENQNRPSRDYFKPFRLFAGCGMALSGLVWAACVAVF